LGGKKKGDPATPVNLKADAKDAFGKSSIKLFYEMFDYGKSRMSK
jgi:hypothetical protein